MKSYLYLSNLYITFVTRKMLIMTSGFEIITERKTYPMY